MTVPSAQPALAMALAHRWKQAEQVTVVQHVPRTASVDCSMS